MRNDAIIAEAQKQALSDRQLDRENRETKTGEDLEDQARYQAVAFVDRPSQARLDFLAAVDVYMPAYIQAYLHGVPTNRSNP